MLWEARVIRVAIAVLGVLQVSLASMLGASGWDRVLAALLAGAGAVAVIGSMAGTRRAAAICTLASAAVLAFPLARLVGALRDGRAEEWELAVIDSRVLFSPALCIVLLGVCWLLGAGRQRPA